MLEKIKNIPTLDFNKLKESVVNSFGKKSLKLLNSSNLCN